MNEAAGTALQHLKQLWLCSSISNQSPRPAHFSTFFFTFTFLTDPCTLLYFLFHFHFFESCTAHFSTFPFHFYFFVEPYTIICFFTFPTHLSAFFFIFTFFVTSNESLSLRFYFSFQLLLTLPNFLLFYYF